MKSNLEQCVLKIKRLLDKSLDLENVHAGKINSIHNKLLRELSRKSTEVGSTLITLPIFSEWITQAVATWSASKIAPSTDIAAFTLNLGSLLSQNEERFCILNSDNFFFRLIGVLNARSHEVAPSVKLGYIKLLAAFLEHKSGVEWIIASNFWKDVLQLGLTLQTFEIVKESRLFIVKILKQTIDQNEAFCHSFVKNIMLPLDDNIYRSIKASTGTGEEVRLQQLVVVLKLIGNVLENLIESEGKDFRVAFIFMENFNLKGRIADFMLMAQNTLLQFDLQKIMFIMQFLELCKSINNKTITAIEIINSVNNIRNNFTLQISRSCIDNILKFTNFGYVYWHLVSSRIANIKENNLTFTDLTLIQLLPSFCLAFKYCYSVSEFEELLSDDIFHDIYIDKLYKMMSLHTFRLCFGWRDFLVEQPNLGEIGIKSLTYIIRSRYYYPTEQAVIVFQELIYILKDFMSTATECPQKFELFSKHVDYFALVFEVIAILIEEFPITWRNSVEVIDVMTVTFDFLTIPMCPVKLMVRALALLNISITKYTSPNLALLVDKISDSTIALLGPLLHAKLCDEVWEVKKVAVEVVCSMSRVSNSQFPSLQKVLMDSELPTLVVKMSTCDGESFVRATAIKCLQEMIQVEEIWNNILKAEDLPLKMRDILLNETEGIVRVEAATFMCIAYENQQFQPETLDTIYETMIYSSTTDLHWEVKVRALGFWDKVIKNHLQNQGMIDGSFPNVTFSKEHRKIVTLTDAEIRKRLQKVLNQLSSIGCLGVLVSAIKDDCDMEVSKTAVKITQSLVDLFKKYNVYGDLGAPTSPLPVENGVSSSVSMSSGISVDESMDSPNNFFNSDFTDEIINEIVNSKDVSLLKNVYSPSDYGSVVNYDFQVRKIISPNEFLQFTQQDLNNVIAEKKNWLNGIEDLGSLLDDMLKTYDDDVNNMDCY